LAAHIEEQDDQLLVRLLTPAQHDLFQKMAPNDQRHSIHVCYTLLQAGKDQQDLLVAALLHDAGKSAGRIWLWQRTLIVLLRRWAPDLLQRLAHYAHHGSVSWWQRGFVTNQLHPELGAQWAEEAGCSPTTVALIRRHQDPVTLVENDLDQLLADLQWADGVN
jgi:hypothetical protein